MSEIIKKEDSKKQDSSLNTDNLESKATIIKIPIKKVIDRFYGYLEQNDYDGALKHLMFWKNEADSCGDSKGKISVLNELLSLYEKTDKKDKALSAVNELLGVIQNRGSKNSVSNAAAYINCAAVCKTFGALEQSATLFEMATAIYEKELREDDPRLGGLYNNFGLLQTELKNFDAALHLFSLALETMSKCVNGDLEMCITYLNIANVFEDMLGLKEGENDINECIFNVEQLILNHSPRDGYYAFICEKCAPSFNYYGHSELASELKKRAKRIYDRA